MKLYCGPSRGTAWRDRGALAALAGTFEKLSVRVGTDEGDVRDAVLVMFAVNTLALLPIVLLLYYPEYGLTPTSRLAFLAAGVFGSLFGRLCMFTSIARIGASRTTPIVSAWVLISTVLGIIFLEETLTAPHAAAVVLIVVGVVVITWETSADNPDDLSRRDLGLSLVLPFAAATFFGIEPIFANLGFAEGTPAVVGLVIKSAAALAGFVLYLAYAGQLPERSRFRWELSKWYVLAGTLGTTFFLGYYLGLEVAPVNVVAPVIATETVFIPFVSALFIPKRLEEVTCPVIVASVGVLAGAVTITVFG